MTIQRAQVTQPQIIFSREAMQTASLATITSATHGEAILHLTGLLEMSQNLCGQMHEGVSRLCQEVIHVTQGHAQLLLHNRKIALQRQLPPGTINHLPVRFGDTTYGSLCLKADPDYPDTTMLSLPVAKLLAQICAWVLYTLEQSAFVKGQCQMVDYRIHGPLTRREREVLALMCRGYKQEAIADMLSITPATVGKHRQHIYEQLGVHSEHDALLVAYHTGLFSIVDSISS